MISLFFLPEIPIAMQNVKCRSIMPCLWFNFNAGEAIAFYTSLFEDSGLLQVSYYGPEGPGPEGELLTATFTLGGQKFMALNGGPEFRFTEAISLMVSCDSQEEIDYLWESLSADGGREDRCGWLKDRFGLSWQVVPSRLGDLMQSENSGKVMQALLQMKKLDIAVLEEAARAHP